MNPKAINKRVRTISQRKDSKKPRLPLITDKIDKGLTETLILHWLDLCWKEKEKGIPTMPFYYYSAKHCAGSLTKAEKFIELEGKFFDTLIKSVKRKVEIHTPKAQYIAQTKCLTNLKTIPFDGVFHDDPPSLSTAEKYNYIPRNFDRSQFTTLETGNFVRVLANFDNRNNFTKSSERWHFIISRGGTFGWINSHDCGHPLKTFEIKKGVEGFLDKKSRKRAFINVPLVKIDNRKKELIQTGRLTSPYGFSLGAEILVDQINKESFATYLPTDSSKECQFRVSKRLIRIGYKKPIPENILADYRKLLGQPYAWGRNPIWNKEAKTFYFGLVDCSSVIRNVLRMYGLYLPPNSTMQSLMGKELFVNKETDDTEAPLTKRQIEKLKLSNFTPGLTFLSTKGHIAVVVSKPKKEIRLLHATFHPRIYMEKDKEIPFTKGKDPFNMDKVRESGLCLLDKKLFPKLSPDRFIWKPTKAWCF